MSATMAYAKSHCYRDCNSCFVAHRAPVGTIGSPCCGPAVPCLFPGPGHSDNRPRTRSAWGSQARSIRRAERRSVSRLGDGSTLQRDRQYLELYGGRKNHAAAPKWQGKIDP